MSVDAAMNGPNVPMKIGPLLKSLGTKPANKLWNFAALFSQVPVQRAFVRVRALAVVARVRLVDVRKLRLARETCKTKSSTCQLLFSAT